MAFIAHSNGYTSITLKPFKENNKIMLGSTMIITCTLLFLIVFGLWQFYDLLMAYLSPPSELITPIHLAIYAFAFAVFILFVKFGKSNLNAHGFRSPIYIGKSLLLSISFAVLYIVIFLIPGFMRGFGTPQFPGIPYGLAFRISNAILLSLTTESIFRGYIFRNLTRKYGFFTSLYASSLMFSLHQVSIMGTLYTSMDQIIIDTIFNHILVNFAAGLFLGYFFYKMGWSLLGVLTFRVGTVLFLLPTPIISASPPWWIGLSFQVMAYACLILVLDSAIKEPKYLLKRYGLES